MKLNIFIAFVLSLAAIGRQAEGIVCPPNQCQNVTCSNIDEKSCEKYNGKVVEKSGFCGCCATCIIQLDFYTMEVKLLIAIALSLAAIVSQAEGIVCPKDYCGNVTCSNIDENKCQQRNGKVVENSSFCGCCATCVIQLGEGENCFDEIVRGVPPRAKCGNDLCCNLTSVTCVKCELF